MEEEIWKSVEGYEGLYEVSNLGQVRRIKSKGVRGGLLKPQVDKDGYLKVHLCKEGKRKKPFVHRLVGKAFLEKIDYKQTVIDHINHVKTDNRQVNLRWVSISENAMNKKKLKRNKTGCPGVFFRESIGKYIVTIGYNNTTINGGNFSKLEDAIAKRKELEQTYFGKYAFKE